MIPRVTQDYLDNGAAKGNRNNALMDAACQLRDARFNQADATRMLKPRALDDGLSENESLATIESAFSRSPRDACNTGVDLHAAKNGKNDSHPKPTVYRKVHVQPERLPSPMDNGAITFLQTTFKQGEFVAIGEGYEKKDANGNLSIPINKGIFSKPRDVDRRYKTARTRCHIPGN